MKVGIINVTGYAGMELARLLKTHPRVQLTSVTGRSAAGQRLGQYLPHLADLDLPITAELGKVDLAFSALDHKESAPLVAAALETGARVVDLSADFRLKEQAEYESWYGVTHPAPHLLPEAVYGLTELHRRRVAGARLVANPGCYPTGAILALAPALREGLIERDIIIDAKSGVSGAGRSLRLTSHFCEVNENVSAYGLEGHRHLPEIIQELRAFSPEVRVTFLPHLIPMTRGILSSCYAQVREGRLPMNEGGKQELVALYRDFYRGEPFTRVTDQPPHTKQTLGNNLCLLYPTLDVRTGRLIVISCLDNLVKGASGQAIQNMNVMLGFPETAGLEAIALWP